MQLDQNIITLICKILLIVIAGLLAFLTVYLEYTGNPSSVMIKDLVLQLGSLIGNSLPFETVPFKGGRP